MRRILLTFSFVACILLAASSGLRAQPGGQNGLAGMALGGPVGIMTEEQRASYQEALRAMHPQIAELDAKLRTARQDFLNTALTGKSDENVLREKALAAARIEAELSVIRAKAFSQMKPPFTPEQIEKVKTGQYGPVRPFEHARPQPPAISSTNHDPNGLPPKQ
jgi:Spy/CpxP family protein refolding chaperone